MTIPSWTPAKAARRSRGSLRRAELALVAVAYEWGDVDNTVVGMCEEAINLIAELGAAVAYAADPERDAERAL